MKRMLCSSITILLLFCACSAPVKPVRSPDDPAVSEEGSQAFGILLADLLSAMEDDHPDPDAIGKDLEAIRTANENDYALAKVIADSWEKLYLEQDYPIVLHSGKQKADELRKEKIPNRASHAIVVLGYELENGQMRPELKGRCDAAAAMARTYPKTILVCSGGATGENNPEGNTEAGLMKAYLTDSCGIDASRIFTDEKAMTTADNAVNTFKILQERSVRSMTIVTSDYHQKRGQLLYSVIGELYRQQYGYAPAVIGNYNYEIGTDDPAMKDDHALAIMQIVWMLKLPSEARGPINARFEKAD